MLVASLLDSQYMHEALKLAANGINYAKPNPLVGCIIVKNNNIIGRGWHKNYGDNHAEIAALENCNESPQNATCYVNLEPCAHYGKTPPCSKALIKAGIKRVVYLHNDPNPLVSGRGIQQLQKNNIITTLLNDTKLIAQAQKLNQGFFYRMRHHKPWLRSKIACSLDGKIALVNGKSKWISCEQSRHDVQQLRLRSCAILSTATTVIRDNARLNLRLQKNYKPLTRIILDKNLTIASYCEELVINKTAGKKIIITQHAKTPIQQEKINQLKKHDFIVHEFTTNAQQNIDINEVLKFLANIYQFNEIQVEAGSKFNSYLLENNLVNELVIYFSPIFLGNNSLSWHKLIAPNDINQAKKMQIIQTEKIGHCCKIICLHETNEELAHV